MATIFQDLRWRQAYITRLGCVEGCLDYLGHNPGRAWLFGGTGHAFVLNVHDDLCVSGPTAWNARMLFDLASNLGYRVSGVQGWKDSLGPDFPKRQREAWDFVRSSIDRGIPCVGWQLEVPDYYVITGYDEVGYYYSGWGCDDGKGPLPWERLGDWDVAAVEVYAIAPTDPASSDPASSEKVVHDGLASALRHAEGPSDWVFPRYYAASRGFDVWADALESGLALREGHAYNAVCWHECREQAVAFLEEARRRLPERYDDLLSDAARSYTAVRDALEALTRLHPMSGHDPDWSATLLSREAGGIVREAGVAEREGLAALRSLVALLESADPEASPHMVIDDRR